MSNSQAKQDNKFTPGEWTTNYSSFGVVIFNDQCQRIANIPNNNPNSVADAELIAAAPELLDLACFMRDWLLERRTMGDMCIGCDDQHRLLIKSESVINKARVV